MTDDIKKLREITSAGIMDCKKAFSDAGGDFDEALALIRKRGLSRAEKKSDRITSAGLIHSYIHNDRVGVMLELRCETDFVAKNLIFQNLAHNLAMHIIALNPINVEELIAQNYVRDESLTVENLIKSVIAQLGENIKVEKFCRYEI